jgi:ABC-type transport system substrate-binding protein
MGIDKKEIARAAFRMDTSPQVTDNFIPPKLPGFLPLDGGMSFNPEEAKKILLQAGFSGEGSFPRLTLFLQEDGRAAEPRLYAILKEQLAALGIDLRLREFRAWEDIKPSGDPYLILLHWSLDFPDPENLVLPLFHSGAALNQSLLHYSNPRLDELAKAAEIEQSRTERIALFHEIEGLLQSDVPAVPLFSRYHRLALQPYVRGVRPPPLGFFYLDAKDIWLDK